MKPLPLRVGQYVGAVAAVGGVVGLVLAPFDLHIYSLGESIVGGKEFLVRLGPSYAAAVAALTVASLSLLRDYPWSRAAMMISWPFLALLAALDAYQAPGGSFLAGVQGGSVLLFGGGIAALYLYRNEAAVAYFNALRSNAAA